MKNLVALAFVVLLSPVVHATGLSVSVTPNTPIVFPADVTNPDGTKISGPWFQARYSIISDQVITLVALKITVHHVNSTDVVKYYDLKQVEVAAGSTFETDPIVFDQLPAASDYSYDVDLEFEGWTGTANNPIDRITWSTSFKTQ